jgi:methylphosphotriester-DNA--protein-cysteine methyltransferase
MSNGCIQLTEKAERMEMRLAITERAVGLKLGVRNYAPAADLAPFVRRYFIIGAEVPADHVIEDMLLAEVAFVRILIKGEWSAQPPGGEWKAAGNGLLFGGNSRPLQVKSKGPFQMAAFAVRPSAWRSLFTQPASNFVNDMVPLADAWGDVADQLVTDVSRAKSDAAMVKAMDRAVRTQLQSAKRPRIDQKIALFEKIARTDSTTKVEDIAKLMGLSVRQFERRCHAVWGLSPKAILRRSRFLDMAESMRGMSKPGEEHLAGLRYFDQSHLNREFWYFAGMTPGKFAKATTPLFDETLRLRIAGKTID